MFERREFRERVLWFGRRRRDKIISWVALYVERVESWGSVSSGEVELLLGVGDWEACGACGAMVAGIVRWGSGHVHVVRVDSIMDGRVLWRSEQVVEHQRLDMFVLGEPQYVGRVPVLRRE